MHKEFFINTVFSKSIWGATLALSLVLVGCDGIKFGKSDKDKPKAPSGQAQPTPPAPSGERVIIEGLNSSSASVDQIVQAAELLVDPVNFSVADSLFTTALIVSPENKKAQFYKVMLKPFMLYKGILHRIRPYVRSLKQEEY
jgi:hypothetical protein